MLMPSIFGENLFDDFFNDFPFYDDKAGQKIEKKLYGRHGQNLMKTDIKEMEDGYELEMDLPGFKKEEISISLEDGNLTIQAAKGLDEDEKEKKSGRYIRRERYAHPSRRRRRDFPSCGRASGHRSSPSGSAGSSPDHRTAAVPGTSVFPSPWRRTP